MCSDSQLLGLIFTYALDQKQILQVDTAVVELLLARKDIAIMRLLVRGAVQHRYKPSDVERRTKIAACFIRRQSEAYFSADLSLTSFLLLGLKTKTIDDLMPLIVEL